jgi:hypothetical protein
VLSSRYSVTETLSVAAEAPRLPIGTDPGDFTLVGDTQVIGKEQTP